MTVKDLFIGDFSISQFFGKNPEIYKQFNIKGHNGIDFRTPNGTPLVCCFDEAEVIQTHDDGSGYGKHVKIWDKVQKIVAIYGHCQRFEVKIGDIVKFGQLIALSNNTGFSTGPHLHFGICKVDDNCKRLNTGNGYSGWLNPFDGRMFKWEVQHLKKPIKNPQEGMTTTEENALKELQRVVETLKDKNGKPKYGNVESAARAIKDLVKDAKEYKGHIRTMKEQELRSTHKILNLSECIKRLEEEARIMKVLIGQRDLKITELEDVLLLKQTTQPTANDLKDKELLALLISRLTMKKVKDFVLAFLKDDRVETALWIGLSQAVMSIAAYLLTFPELAKYGGILNTIVYAVKSTRDKRKK